MWQEIHQGKCETNVLLFTSISYERKHVSDLSMLVFCFRGHMFVVYLRTTKFHNNSVFKDSLYTFYSRKPTCGIPPCLRISNRKYPPLPSEFHNREPPLPFRNPKSRPWYSMDIFWNRPISAEDQLWFIIDRLVVKAYESYSRLVFHQSWKAVFWSWEVTTFDHLNFWLGERYYSDCFCLDNK